MSRSRSFAYSAIAPILVLALAMSCGHSQEHMDAYEASKKSGATPSGNSGSSTTGGGQVNSCVPPTGPQFDCQAPASQQFDSASMKSYCVPEDVQAQVKEVMQIMTPAEKAQQMMGIDGTARDYRDIERSPDVTIQGFGTIRGYRYRDAGRGVNLDAGQDNRVDTNDNFS